ncbi:MULTISPECIES: LytR/AlgR family response regulator transcription factor [Clostridium]|jgi:two-component system response regulator AgrA|uniref:Stage 0 sporulation protein A homolog n=3 Tax=Clostridium intestinale TaxID=36845 RepID=U2NL67_9CLOT|nr:MULTISPECIES: LytTR family DNA-binding domain-containing protein [Clostridium]ERK29591.1 Accessory gene regulator protein A [Clostridium intestinale URNW]QLY80902.1 response regulator transcription factor [Clostridium intestinale]WRY51664.1 LytTR family DNA-binding domain-containing protein [Clostridium intestinale]SHI24416.1 two component transcriptional regulator, LytTR family [Clostridium intestinale DSM 6191]
MLNIYVCEDDEKQRDSFAKFIDDITIIENLDMKLALSTGDPYELIEYVKQSKYSGVYFLDVDLNSNIDGIRLAEKIRKYDSRGFVIFVTTHAEMSYLTFVYRVEALDYIIKDDYLNIKNRIHQCILEALDKYSRRKKDNDVFTINTDERIINVEYDKILFFETSKKIHKIVLHATDRQVEFYGQMKDIEEDLDENFIRVHKSYLVNKKNISEINKLSRKITMKNGEQCIISIKALRKI